MIWCSKETTEQRVEHLIKDAGLRPARRNTCYEILAVRWSFPKRLYLAVRTAGGLPIA